MAVVKKPKAKEEGSMSRSALKRPKPAGAAKKEALRRMVKAAIANGSATPELLAAVRKKWGSDFAEQKGIAKAGPSPKPVEQTRARKRPAVDGEKSPKAAVPKKRKTTPQMGKAANGQPDKKVANFGKKSPAFGKKRTKREKKAEEEEEDLTGLSKKQLKVRNIMKKTVKPENLSKKERRALRLARRKDGSLVHQLLVQWEELRAGHCPPERRIELCQAIIDASRGKIKELILAHDTSRVFESVMKHGNTEQRLLVLEEIKKDVPQLIKTKFAKFVVKKMLLHGTREHKANVFAALEGAVAKMVVHRQAVEVLNEAFNDHANAAQRANIVQEVFGPPFSLFKLPGVSKLSEAFAAEPKTKKETVLAHVKTLLTQAITKGNASFYILHYLLLDFLENCSAADRTDIAQQLKEQIVPLLHTREGVKVAMTCLWNANNKDRKVILKCMKTFIANTALDEHGYLFILAVLDAVDDIVFLNKTVMKELFESLDTLFANVHGRKVLLYLLDRRNTCYFHPQLLENILSKGDGNPYTKKSADLRTRELRERCLPALLRFVSENMATVCGSNGGLMVLREVLTHGGALTDPFRRCVGALVQCLTSGEKVCEGDETVIENAAAHLALKKALQKDKEHGGHFSTHLLEQLNEAAVETIIASNRGCFLLVHLCEASDAAVKFLKAMPTITKSLPKKNFPGAKILAKKLV